jgi:hypothetical protein
MDNPKLVLGGYLENLDIKSLPTYGYEVGVWVLAVGF